MKKIYVVFVSTGEWDDYEDHPVQAFIDETKANEFMSLEKDKREKEKVNATKKSIKTKRKLYNGKLSDEQFDKLWDEWGDLEEKANYTGIFVREVDLDESI
jgi:hypothetical protein